MDQRRIHQIERLRRCRRRLTLIDAQVRIGTIEKPQIRMLAVPLLHQINTSMRRFIDGMKRIVDRESPSIDRRKRMLLGYPSIEQPADTQNRIPQGLGIHRTLDAAPQPTVSRVKLPTLAHPIDVLWSVDLARQMVSPR